MQLRKFNREKIGEERYKSLINGRINHYIARLLKTKKQLLAKGVPEKHIVYVIRNEGDTLGGVYFTIREAVLGLGFLFGCRVIHRGNGVGFDCEAVDGYDFSKLRSMLSRSWGGKGEWDKYAAQLEKRAKVPEQEISK
jgi:hypothetical protein